MKTTLIQNPTGPAPTSPPIHQDHRQRATQSQAGPHLVPRFIVARAAGLSVIGALLLSATGWLHAATETWDGGGANNNLTTAANWLDNTTPTNFSDIVFAGSTRLAPVVNTNFYMHSLVFGPTAGAFHITETNGWDFYVSDGGISNQTSLNQTVDRLVLTDTPLSIVAGTGQLTIGTLLGYDSGYYSYPVYPTMTGNITVTNCYVDGTITYNGGGTFTFDNDFNYYNSICWMSLTVNGGTVRTTAPLWAEDDSWVGAEANYVLNAGSFLPGDDFTLYGVAQLTRASGAVFAMPAGKAFNIWWGAGAAFTGSYSPDTAMTTYVSGSASLTATTAIAINNGAALLAENNSTVQAGSYLDVGNGSAGVLSATGAGTTVTATSISDWGRGAVGTVTFSDQATGNFDTVRITTGNLGGTGSALVRSNANLMTGSLQIGTSTNVGASGVLTVTGAGSTVTMATNANLTIGTTTGGTGQLNVDNGGVFNTGLAASQVNATGKIKLTGSSTLNLNGDLTLNGGMLDVGLGAAGGVFLTNGHTLRLQSGGDAQFAGPFTLNKAATIQVSGAGSTFRSTGSVLDFKGGSTVTVDGGGQLSANLDVDIGNGGNATLTVNGAGSSLTAGGTCNWGDGGGVAHVTLSNGATGTVSTLRLASTLAGNTSDVSVRSNADLTVGSLYVGTSGLAGTATLTVSDVGSSLVQTGASTFTLGAAFTTSASLIVDASATFGTGTGLATIASSGTVGIINGGMMTVKGSLVHNGLLIANDGSLTVNGSAQLNGQIYSYSSGSILFKGAVSGVSQFSGSGHVEFAGSYSPGASAAATAAVTFQPNVAFKPTSALIMEIGGINNFDKLTFLGSGGLPLQWGGTLSVMLINGFMPQAGQSFDLFDFAPGGSPGTFGNLSLASLPLGLFWRTDRLYTEGVLYISSTPQTWAEFQAAYEVLSFAGDDNGDGIPNGIEFLLGMNPMIPNSSSGLLKMGAVVHAPGDTTAHCTFNMPASPAQDAHYLLVARNSLTAGSWTLIAQKTGSGPWSGTAVVTESPGANGMVMATVAETLPPDCPARFYRLGGQTPPP